MEITLKQCAKLLDFYNEAEIELNRIYNFLKFQNKKEIEKTGKVDEKFFIELIQVEQLKKVVEYERTSYVIPTITKLMQNGSIVLKETEQSYDNYLKMLGLLFEFEFMDNKEDRIKYLKDEYKGYNYEKTDEYILAKNNNWKFNIL